MTVILDLFYSINVVDDDHNHQWQNRKERERERKMFFSCKFSFSFFVTKISLTLEFFIIYPARQKNTTHWKWRIKKDDNTKRNHWETKKNMNKWSFREYSFTIFFHCSRWQVRMNDVRFLLLLMLFCTITFYHVPSCIMMMKDIIVINNDDLKQKWKILQKLLSWCRKE